jgi:hypothetical protein
MALLPGVLAPGAEAFLDAFLAGGQPAQELAVAYGSRVERDDFEGEQQGRFRAVVAEASGRFG